MNIRERTEKNEKDTLMHYAAFSAESKGRKRYDEPCDIRTEFQRDRDRIIHSNAFRRLKHKTQVFLAPLGDHYRTRLTHTLEVSQIARTIARALLLNEDLTEAVALGHDLGHTPFGHAGERALNDVSSIGFAHYEQSVRIAEVLENLNLTFEVRNGILCHTKGEQAETLEGRIVRISDRIAYINHDIDDGIRAGVLKETDIPDNIRRGLGGRKTARIDALVRDVIENSTDKDIKMSPNIKMLFDELHEFMFESVYRNKIAKSEEGKARELVIKLFSHFKENPDALPYEYAQICENEGAERAAMDYIAGMSDRFAVSIYSDLFIPKGWERV